MGNNIRIARELVRIARSLVAKNWTSEIMYKRPSLTDPEAVNKYLQGLHNPKKEKMVAYWLLDKKTIDFPFSRKTSEMIEKAWEAIQYYVKMKDQPRIDFQDYDSPQKLLEEYNPDANRPKDSHEYEQKIAEQHPEFVPFFLFNDLYHDFSWEDEQEIIRILLNSSQHDKDYYLDRGRNGIDDLFAVKTMINEFPGITLKDFSDAIQLKMFQMYGVPGQTLLDNLFKNDQHAAAEMLKKYLNDKKSIPSEVEMAIIHSVKSMSSQMLDALESSQNIQALELAAIYETDPNILNGLMQKAINNDEYMVLWRCLQNKNINEQSLKIIVDNLEYIYDLCCEFINIRPIYAVLDNNSTNSQMLEKMYKFFKSQKSINHNVLKDINEKIIQHPNTPVSLLLDMLHSSGSTTIEERLLMTNERIPVQEAIKHYEKHKIIYDDEETNYINIFLLEYLLQRNDIPENFMVKMYHEINEDDKIMIIRSLSCPVRLVWDMLKNHKDCFKSSIDFEDIKNINPAMLAYIYQHADEYTEFKSGRQDAAEELKSLISGMTGFPSGKVDKQSVPDDIQSMDKTTSPGELDEIAKRSKDCWKNIALNPSTSGETLDYISKSSDTDVKRAVARHESTLPTTLESLSHDKDEYVRYLVASNPHTPKDTLWRMHLEDESEKVSDVALINVRRYGGNQRKQQL